jgi:hypothetical protein
MRRGAGWFLTIAVLSGINSVLQIVDAKIRFIFGLGITQVMDAVGKGAGQNGMFITVAVDGIFLLMLILCWKWAKAGSQGAFLTGMMLTRWTECCCCFSVCGSMLQCTHMRCI